MKRFSWIFSCLFFISIFLVAYAYAITCSKQGVQNPPETKWSSKQEPLLIAASSSPQSDTYAQAEALFKEKKYDDVIRLLSGPAYAEPFNFKLNFLLAKAQVEKCAILKAQGDKSYKTLIHEPYRTGRRFHKVDKTLPEPYYIVAKSLLINNRLSRAGRTIKKALYFSPNNADYLVVLGDVCHAQAEYTDDSYQANRLFSEAKGAYEKAIKNIGENAKEFRTEVEAKLQKISEKMK